MQGHTFTVLPVGFSPASRPVRLTSMPRRRDVKLYCISSGEVGLKSGRRCAHPTTLPRLCPAGNMKPQINLKIFEERTRFRHTRIHDEGSIYQIRRFCMTGMKRDEVYQRSSRLEHKRHINPYVKETHPTIYRDSIFPKLLHGSAQCVCGFAAIHASSRRSTLARFGHVNKTSGLGTVLHTNASIRYRDASRRFF